MEKIIIGVFCYRRSDKLKSCIEALLKNPECASMDIVFFSDGYRDGNDKAGVLATRAYINSITEFKNVFKHFRDRNFTTGPNFFTGLTFLCDNYDSFIVVEDDLVVTPNFLSYMLSGLQFYKSDESVFSVSGFCFPLKVKNYSFDTFIAKRFSCYGWASWANRVKDVVWTRAGLEEILNTSPHLKGRLDGEGWDLYRMAKKQISGILNTWDIQVCVHVLKYQYKIVYPIISKVSNIGFDDESTNTFGVDFLKTPQDSGTNRKFKFCEVDLIEPSLIKQLKKPFGVPALATRKIINEVVSFSSNLKKKLEKYSAF